MCLQLLQREGGLVLALQGRGAWLLFFVFLRGGICVVELLSVSVFFSVGTRCAVTWGLLRLVFLVEPFFVDVESSCLSW